MSRFCIHLDVLESLTYFFEFIIYFNFVVMHGDGVLDEETLDDLTF